MRYFSGFSHSCSATHHHRATVRLATKLHRRRWHGHGHGLVIGPSWAHLRVLQGHDARPGLLRRHAKHAADLLELRLLHVALERWALQQQLRQDAPVQQTQHHYLRCSSAGAPRCTGCAGGSSTERIAWPSARPLRCGGARARLRAWRGAEVTAGNGWWGLPRGPDVDSRVVLRGSEKQLGRPVPEPPCYIGAGRRS